MPKIEKTCDIMLCFMKSFIIKGNILGKLKSQGSQCPNKSDCSYWTFKELSTLTKYTRLGRLPKGKSQVKRFGVSIHHSNTAI